MRRAITGRKLRHDVYKYSLPSRDPESTAGWTPAEKLLAITLRQIADERGSLEFEMSDDELAERMDLVLRVASTAMSARVN